MEDYVNRPKEGTVIADGQPPFTYEQACQYGDGINARIIVRACLRLRRMNNITGAEVEEYDNPESSPYQIKTCDGTPFPFDSRFGFVWEQGRRQDKLK